MNFRISFSVSGKQAIRICRCVCMGTCTILIPFSFPLCMLSRFFFFLPLPWHVGNSWGQGLNPCYSSDLSHCSDCARSLTC